MKRIKEVLRSRTRNHNRIGFGFEHDLACFHESDIHQTPSTSFKPFVCCVSSSFSSRTNIAGFITRQMKIHFSVRQMQLTVSRDSAATSWASEHS